MFFQFVTEETLVPPNFNTTHGDSPRADTDMLI
jgi:hypothetical protein